MRSSLFKPVIMPGRSAMWREETLSWELRRLKTRGLELAAVSTEAQQLGHRTGGGLVLTCNPDPGLLLIPLWSHYGVVRMSLVLNIPSDTAEMMEDWIRERESQRQHNDLYLEPGHTGHAWPGFKLIQIRIKNKLNERHKHYLMPSLQILS